MAQSGGRVNAARMEERLTLRLTLLCAGATALSRIGGFPDPAEPLDGGERRRAAALRPPGGAPDHAFVAPTAAARETAEAMGLTDAVVEPRLADMDHGAWAGLSFAEVNAGDGAALAAWLAAPEEGAPGGESLSAVMARVAPWLAEASAREGRLLAVTPPMAARAMLCAVLALPPAAAMRIDLAPLDGATLSFHRGWRLRALTPRWGGHG